MIQRVTHMGPTRTMLADLQHAQRSLQVAQRQISSGKKLQRVSDGPAQAVTALDHRATLRRADQLQRNRDRAQDWLALADGTLSDADTSLAAARSLLIQGNSGAISAESRAAVADQLRAIRSDLLAQAGTTHLGRAIFAGTAAGPAYDANGQYLGDTGAVSIPITPGVTTTVTRTGPEVFGTYDATDPTAGDVFQLIEHLAAAVEAGDTVAMTAGLGQIDAAKSRIQTVQAELGSRLRQLEDLDLSQKVRKDELAASVSELEDVDLAEAYMQVASREAAYQAAVAVAARVIQPSILDFLR